MSLQKTIKPRRRAKHLRYVRPALPLSVLTGARLAGKFLPGRGESVPNTSGRPLCISHVLFSCKQWLATDSIFPSAETTPGHT